MNLDLFNLSPNNQDWSKRYQNEEEISYTDSKRNNFSILFYVLLITVINIVVQVIIMGIYQGVIGINLVTLAETNPELYESHITNISAYANFAVYLIGFVVVIILMRNFLVKDFQNLSKIPVGKILLLIALGVGLIWLSNILSTIVLSLFKIEDQSTNEESLRLILNSHTTNLLLTSITTIFFGPMLEELVFRKSCFNFFGKHNSIILTILISSILFGAIHIAFPLFEAIGNFVTGSGSIKLVLSELVYLIVYSILGLALGITYQLSNRNILITIFVHIINNIFALVAAILVK